MRYALCVLASLATFTPAAHAAALTLGAVGDSISAGTNTSRLGDNRDLSWSTGTRAESDSHLKKLSLRYGQPVTGRNEAVSGSTVHDLEPQITRVLAYRPDFLTITVGANDVCSWSATHSRELELFETTLQAHLQRIVDALPHIKIYVAAIPDMYNLWQIASQRSGCQSRWNLMRICPALLARDVSELDRQGFVERWRDANDAIEAVAGRFPNNVYFDPSMAETRFEWQHVSTVDCFHPSVAGQNLLSEKTWEGGWLQ